MEMESKILYKDYLVLMGKVYILAILYLKNINLKKIMMKVRLI